MERGIDNLKSSLTVANPEDDDVSREVYLGVVKSYNDRRGFGFLACTETADRFGRDVYMPKAEATMAALLAAGVDREAGISMVMNGNCGAAATAAAVAAAPRGPDAAKAAAAAAQQVEKVQEGEKSTAPRLAEEDIVFFRVRLSVEGYPQAVCVQRLRKVTGSVLLAPSHTKGSIVSEEAVAVCGRKEVVFDTEACGQLRLIPGDVVTFCIPEAEEKLGAVAKPASSPAPGAKMISLCTTSRAGGTVLGCFTLDLPRTHPENVLHAPMRANLKLPCHAFGDKLVLARLTDDLDEAELMRFFSKQGATGAIVAHARACSFASVSFASIADVARFLGRIAHAFADDRGTLVARLLPLDPKLDAIATLPALPAPQLSAKDSSGEDLEAGALLVLWSPLVLAVAYSVELRPAGADGPWASVDVGSKMGNNSHRFDSTTSSCKVTSLHLSTRYEARVSYFTDCGTTSEASEASEPCTPSQGDAKAGPKTVTPVTAVQGVGAGVTATNPPHARAPEYVAPVAPHYPPSLSTLPPAPTSSWSGWSTTEAYPPPLPLPQAVPPPDPFAGYPPPAPVPAPPPPAWRSPAGLVVPPPAAPELQTCDDRGFALNVMWPCVLQAVSYVVEIRAGDGTTFERFVRAAPEAKLGLVVEMRVAGLRPAPPPGRFYLAQVRSVGADGWESPPGPSTWSAPLICLDLSSLDPNELREREGVYLLRAQPGLSASATPWEPKSWKGPEILSTSEPAKDFGYGWHPGMPPPPANPPVLGSATIVDDSAKSEECLILD